MNAGSGASVQGFLANVEDASDAAKEYFGLGLLDDIDLFTVAARLKSGTAETDAVGYRSAIEALAALVRELSAIDINTDPNDLFSALARDLSDGDLDAAVSGTPIDDLGGIGGDMLLATLTKRSAEVARLIVPATTSTPVSAINQLLVDEAAVLEPGLNPDLPSAPTLAGTVPGEDGDGDGIVDVADQFPNDPSRAGDTDGDGVDDLTDEFPNDPLESVDSDGDGVGDNSDVFPNDPSRQDASDNTAPNADAGNDISVETSTVANLNGSRSSDPDGDMITYAWQIVSAPAGSVAALVDATTPMPSFVPVLDGDYVVELTVDDGFANDSDIVTVTASTVAVNEPPTANAGPDQQVEAAQGAIVTLDGTQSNDPNGDPLNYSWSIVSFENLAGMTAPSPVSLVGADTAMPSFEVTVPGELGTYTIELTVSDGEFDSTDQVVIELAKSFPTASLLFGAGFVFFGAIAISRRWARLNRL